MSAIPSLASLASLASSLVLAGVLVGCTSETGNGAPPTLKDLAVTPSALQVGKATVLTGRATLEDADGDVTAMLGEVTLPNGSVQALQQTNLANASGARTAPVQFSLQVSVMAPGDYALTLWLKDAEGNESARVRQTLTAQ